MKSEREELNDSPPPVLLLIKPVRIRPIVPVMLRMHRKPEPIYHGSTAPPLSTDSNAFMMMRSTVRI